MMRLRILEPTEYELITPILAQNNTAPPSPDFAQIMVAQDNIGSVTGLAVVQLIPHLDPVWVTVSERGSGLWEALVREQLESPALKSATGSIFSFVERPGAGRLLAEKFGFEETRYKVMEYKLRGGK